MVGLIVVLLLFALVAAVLGFGVLADLAANIAIVLFVVLLVLFVASLIAGPVRSRWRR